MNPTVRLERADAVPQDARVRDFDELDSDAQHALPGAVDGDPVTLDSPTALEDGEIVKYTGYYRISVAE
ncbi:hypothetical protein [Salarchaeum sp. JOR-1]|uniref:hypothetical protein n=1 Tax=Salarchaeum sp. JOR-1 TaxID=2599399 RepID=UPI0011983FB3|nr:hypothetical protein [Salarchaeum sp. JOR-1]QDX40672.1 hypothetical protein FQU85_07045 [Salarchaeum sp. JOR-1]